MPDHMFPSVIKQSSCPFRDLDSKANHLGDASGTPVKTRRHSWRQQIFLRVATPQKACDSPSRYEGTGHPGSEPVRCLVWVTMVCWVKGELKWDFKSELSPGVKAA